MKALTSIGQRGWKGAITDARRATKNLLAVALGRKPTDEEIDFAMGA